MADHFPRGKCEKKVFENKIMFSFDLTL
jgi:hypothetical protein